MKKIFAAALGAALLSGNAIADLKWGDYRAISSDPKALKNVDDIFTSYIAGAVSALGYANLGLQTSGSPLLYCQPAKLALNPSNVKALLSDKSLKTVKAADDKMPLGMVILSALREAFPC